MVGCCWLAEGGRWPPDHGGDEGVKDEMRMIWVLHLLTLQFRSDIFRHLTEVRGVAGVSKWRRCCSKGTINLIKCPLNRFQLSKPWEIRWSWSGKGEWVRSRRSPCGWSMVGGRDTPYWVTCGCTQLHAANFLQVPERSAAKASLLFVWRQLVIIIMVHSMHVYLWAPIYCENDAIWWLLDIHLNT